MGEAGSVSYLFKPRGVIVIEKSAIAEDALIDLALEAGAEDVNSRRRQLRGHDRPERAREREGSAREAQRRGGRAPSRASSRRSQVPVSEKEAEAVLRLVDALEEHDDVQKVYANFSVSDEVMAKFVR